MKVNGKTYPLWGQFVDRKKEWIGGKLIETNLDPLCGDIGEQGITKITDIKLEPNGDKSAWFEISGEDFNCGFDVHCGGVDGSKGYQKDTIHFATTGQFPMEFKIITKED